MVPFRFLCHNGKFGDNGVDLRLSVRLEIWPIFEGPYCSQSDLDRLSASLHFVEMQTIAQSIRYASLKRQVQENVCTSDLQGYGTC